MADQVLIRRSGHQELDTLDATDIPDLSGDYDVAGAAAAAQSAAATDATTKANAAAAASVPTSRTLSAGTGLTGGGDLSANRSFAPDFGSGAGKVTEGNDSRLSDSRAPNGSAGGDLSGTYPNPSVVDDSHAHTAATLPASSGAPTDATYLTTASHAGLSAEVVVPTAVLTVLDDTTVAAMVDTLGGASSTGTGGLVRATSPTLVTPALGTPASGVATNLTGTASGLTAGNVTTNANLTGPVTSVGNATKFTAGAVQPNRLVSLVSGVLAETFPKDRVTTNVALISTQRLSSMAIQVLNGTPCTSLSFCSATQAAVNPTNWWFALCDSSFNVIRQSTDQLTTAWAANTPKTLAMDSVPTTAGARVASSTVTLTIPTLSEALSTLFTAGDSIVVSNASIAAYNGTFTVASVTSTTITYVSGSSASDSLSAPFPTVQMAAGKRVYTPAADSILYGVLMVKAGTVPSQACSAGGLSGLAAVGTTLCTSGDTSLTGTCPSPIAHGTGAGGVQVWCAIS